MVRRKIARMPAASRLARTIFNRSSYPLKLSLALSLFASALSANAVEIVGRATVIDGDTIEISGQRIRLVGISAPESWQLCKNAAGKSYRCGNEAAFALHDFLAASRPTRCAVHGRDGYRRLAADCARADGVKVNAWLVRQGLAVDWPRYSKGLFKEMQSAAKRERIGIWQGSFDLPCEARASRSGGRSAC